MQPRPSGNVLSIPWRPLPPVSVRLAGPADKVRHMQSLSAAIVEYDEAASFLAWPGDFEFDRKDHVEEVHLASGAALEARG